MLTIAKLDRYDLINSPLGDKPTFTIWFSGCSFHCQGCQNPQLWDKNFGEKFDVPELLQIISYQTARLNIEDIILLGGEPLEQPDLPVLCRCLADEGYKIWLYTGYEFDQISDDIKEHLSFIKTGRYEELLREDTQFPITTNQKVFSNIAGDWKQIHFNKEE